MVLGLPVILMITVTALSMSLYLSLSLLLLLSLSLSLSLSLLLSLLYHYYYYRYGSIQHLVISNESSLELVKNTGEKDDIAGGLHKNMKYVYL